MPPSKKRVTKARSSPAKKPGPRAKKAPSTSPAGKLSKDESITSDVVGIFFKETHEMTTFENKEDAQAFHSKLPRSARSKSELVFFASQEECDDYIQSTKHPIKSPPPPVTPEKSSLPRLSVAIKQENPYKKPSAV